MVQQHFKVSRVRLFAVISTLICLACVANATYAISQLNLPDNTLNFGIRTIASPIGKFDKKSQQYSGFCRTFSDTLIKKVHDSGQPLEINRVPPIVNQYKGPHFSRFYGLLQLNNPIHIECGPNSKTSRELRDPADNQPFSAKIIFSDIPFYQTGIRLLLREDIARDLSNLSSKDLLDKLRQLPIGVLNNTTTFEQFKDKSKTAYRNIVPIDAAKDPNNPNDPQRGTNALERALSALDNNGILDDGRQIQAFASDALILQSFFEEPIDQEGGEGWLSYIKGREPYKNRGFTIFPFPASGDYLPNLSLEQYAIAIKKGTDNEGALLEAINATLGDLEKPTSDLARAQANIKKYESGGVTSEGILSTPTPTPPVNIFSWFPLPLNNLQFWFIVLFGILVLVALFRFRHGVAAKIKSVVGEINLQADGRRGIKARGVKSEEGGFVAQETTRGGIDVKDIHARTDVVLDSSDQLHEVSQKRISQPDSTSTIDARSISAGGNITIAQFVSDQANLAEQLDFFQQDVGIVNPRRDFARSQFEAYCNVWKSLQALRLAGEELWSRASEDNLIRFAAQLRETTRLVHEESLFFQDLERGQLFSALRAFREFRIGKRDLIDINSRQKLDRFSSEGSIPHGSHLQLEIEEQLERNQRYRWDYNEIVDRIRASFRQKLSN
jgi:hypothetical protein